LFTHEPVLDIKWNKNWFNIHGHIHRGVHREFDLTERHFNASVEPLDYKPKPLYEILTYFESILKNAGNRKIV
jgi:calcineurin-like phosphoesterase family protein